MPIFVSRFSPEWVAGASLQRVRSRREEGEDRLWTNAARQERRTGRNGEEEEDRQGRVSPERTREALLVRNQRADLLLARLQDQRNARSEAAGGDAQDDRATAGRGESTRTEVPRRTPPGVGSVRSRADREIARLGRLGQKPANPVAQQALGRFAQLRAVARGEKGQEAGGGNARRALSELPDVRTPKTPPLDREIDARIRLVANRNRARLEAEPEPQAAVPREAAAQPTAVEISRANTTQEIRENLQENTREVERGLRRDAYQQTRVNIRQTARAAAQAGEACREREISSNEAETRELRTEERRLEQELVQTQREIRDLGNRTNRIQGPANRSTFTTAAAIGTRVDLLVG